MWPIRKLIVIAIILSGILAGLVLKNQEQTYQKKASDASCLNPQAYCQWNTLGEGISYEYEIRDINFDFIIAKGLTDSTKITFIPILEHAYNCRVTPVNSCGKGLTYQSTYVCLQPTSTLTPTPTVTQTPSPLPSSPIVTTVPIGGLPTDIPPTLTLIPFDTLIPTLTVGSEPVFLPETPLPSDIELPNISKASESASEKETAAMLPKQSAKPKELISSSVLASITRVLSWVFIVFIVGALIYIAYKKLQKK